MSDQDSKYIDIVIRNTEILTEFTNLVKRIELLVDNLPNTTEYVKHHEDLKYIKKSINNLVLLYKSSNDILKSNDRKIEKIPLIFKNTEDINENIDYSCKLMDKIYMKVTRIEKTGDDLSNWAKVRFPLIMGLINLVLYAIGLYITYLK